ncbi:MAG: hypothetical protein PHI73_03945 [Patescibacteria group bacterium]|nr:hypothetical protein [Patescibacteria group bacterium]
MILKFGREVTLFRVTDARKGKVEPAIQSAGQHKFVEVPNPTIQTGQPWLVLESDQAVGMAKSALLMKEGVSEVKAAV